MESHHIDFPKKYKQPFLQDFKKYKNNDSKK